MTTLRQRTALDAIAISRAPISGHGESFSTAALHACAQAFVATLTSASGAPPKLSKARYANAWSTPDAPGELEMTATNPRTSETVARATCTLGARGQVTSIKAIPSASL